MTRNHNTLEINRPNTTLDRTGPRTEQASPLGTTDDNITIPLPQYIYDNEILIKEFQNMNRFNKLNNYSPNKASNTGRRKLFNQHGKTFLPHDTIPLDLRNIGRPGIDYDMINTTDRQLLPLSTKSQTAHGNRRSYNISQMNNSNGNTNNSNNYVTSTSR